MVKDSVSPFGVTTEAVVSLYRILMTLTNSIGNKDLKHSRAINGIIGFSEIDKRDHCFLFIVFQFFDDLSEGEDMSGY